MGGSGSTKQGRAGDHTIPLARQTVKEARSGKIQGVEPLEGLEQRQGPNHASPEAKPQPSQKAGGPGTPSSKHCHMWRRQAYVKWNLAQKDSTVLGRSYLNTRRTSDHGQTQHYYYYYLIFLYKWTKFYSSWLCKQLCRLKNISVMSAI